MLQAWKQRGIITIAGYIIGFPNDTKETVKRDIEIIKRELPVDILEFFMLTPLPGSEDHQTLHKNGVWMDPDMTNTTPITALCITRRCLTPSGKTLTISPGANTTRRSTWKR